MLSHVFVEEKMDCNSFSSKFFNSAVKSDILRKFIKNTCPTVPLIVLKGCVLVLIPPFVYHRLFVSTIDVQIGGEQRFEIPTVPRFFDLRNPRVLKIKKVSQWKPAIHLDNRYRLMRNEPMLDASGAETDKIGDGGMVPITEEVPE